MGDVAGVVAVEGGNVPVGRVVRTGFTTVGTVVAVPEGGADALSSPEPSVEALAVVDADAEESGCEAVSLAVASVAVEVALAVVGDELVGPASASRVRPLKKMAAAAPSTSAPPSAMKTDAFDFFCGCGGAG